MPDWQERITRDTAPAIRVEHDVRYAAAAPLIAEAATWVELGCGSGVSAARALDGRFAGRAVLVDVDADAVEQATAELGIAETTGIAADLATPEGVAQMREALGDGPGVITCFETLEHLRAFVPLVEALVELAESGRATVLLSVPNDAHWAIENPFHETAWGEGAFAELRTLLPHDHVVARQVPLTGSALVLDGAEQPLEPVAVDEDRVPSHFLAAFGPQAARFAAHAAAEAVDLDAQRRWEREREAYLLLLEHRLEEVRRLIHSSSGPVLPHRRRRLRGYRQRLEDLLGIPRAGTPDRAAYDARQLNP